MYLDGSVLKRSWTGAGRDGYRRIPGSCEGYQEDKAGWSGCLSQFKQRGLRGVRWVISDACPGLVESVSEYYPEADWQKCVIHFYRNVFSHVPGRRLHTLHAMFGLTGSTSPLSEKRITSF